ncbi:MAG: hypothetical protein HY000_02970 [Planctomycetes bacterium]|nr:hypothetical protein [Planctomycetota bacterium]
MLATIQSVLPRPEFIGHGGTQQQAMVGGDQHDRKLPGNPDLIFAAEKVIVFIDGDFWHGWRFPTWQHRLSKWWREKIAGNRQRDKRNHRRIRRQGWTVIRLWEHQVEEDVLKCVRRLVHELGVRRVDWHGVKQQLDSMAPLKRRRRLPKP